MQRKIGSGSAGREYLVRIFSHNGEVPPEGSKSSRRISIVMGPSRYDNRRLSPRPVRERMKVRVQLQRPARFRILRVPPASCEGKGRHGRSRYCVITIDAVRVSGIVTDETRLVSGG